MKTLLLTPGPLTTTDATRVALTARLRRRLRALVHGMDMHETVPTAGSSTFAMKAGVGTLLPRDGMLLVLANGSSGQRLAAIARQVRRRVVIKIWPETEPADPARVQVVLRANPGITDVAVVRCTAGRSGVLPDRLHRADHATDLRTHPLIHPAIAQRSPA